MAPDDAVTPAEPPAPVPTLAESLASADNSFTPLSVAMRDDLSTDPDSVSLTDDFVWHGYFGGKKQYVDCFAALAP